MFALSSSLQTVGRARGALLILGAMIALIAWTPTAAHASGCTNSWASAKSGSWFEKENWTKKAVPTSEEEVCITANGTYTVSMNQTSEGVTVKSLQVGGESGTQTLSFADTCNANARLTTTAGIAIAAQGALAITNAEHCANNDTVVGPITNAGTITTAYAESVSSGGRSLQGSLTNTGTLTIAANTSFNGTSATLSNKGSIGLASGLVLTVSGKSSVTNGSGGKIVATGVSDVLMEPETSFTEGTGTTSGTLPVIVRDAALTYEAAGGESTIAIRGEGSTLSGTTSPKQTLLLQDTCGENVKVTAASGFTNAGAMTLTNAEHCANNDTFVGAITNSGTITTAYAEGVSSGQRNLQGSLTNTGTLTIDAGTSYNGTSAALSNKGSIGLAEGTALTASGKSSVTNGSGGKIAAAGSAAVLMEPETSFTEGTGTTSGTLPVIVRDGALTYEPSGGESTIAIRGEGSTLSGASSSKQALLEQATCGEHAKVTASSTFTNGGSITMEDAENCNNNDTLVGQIVNNGTITTSYTSGASAGTRSLQGNLINNGTFEAHTPVSYNGTKAALTNAGQLNIAEGIAFAVSAEATVTNASGEIATGATGAMTLASGSTFDQKAGKTSGTLPVIIDDGLLVYEGTGESVIAERGETSTVKGEVGAKQSLLLQSTCSSHAKITAAGSFTNAGAITLANADNCGDNSTLVVPEGSTLTNSGTLTTSYVAPVTSGVRTILGSVENTGTINIDVNTSLSNSFASTITNAGTIKLANGAVLSVSGPTTVTNQSGAIEGTGTGALSQSGGTFNEAAGKTTGEPVITTNTAVHYTGTGASTIAQRAEGSTLSGNISKGQTLIIESTCPSHAKTTSGSFSNAGTVELTNAETCGNNATLNLAGGTLTNTGAVDIEEPHGGNRTIEGSLTSEKTVLVAAGANLKLTGQYTQGKKGTLEIGINSASSFGAVTASGAASINGTLELVVLKTFKGTLGQKYAVLSGSALTGTFAKFKKLAISKSSPEGLYYKPVYSPTGVTLQVSPITLGITPGEAPAEAKVTVAGEGYLPEDTITLIFTDHAKHKTTVASVKTGPSGTFSSEVTIPAGAAEGTATFEAKSKLTADKIKQTFKVT